MLSLLTMNVDGGGTLNKSVTPLWPRRWWDFRHLCRQDGGRLLSLCRLALWRIAGAASFSARKLIWGHRSWAGGSYKTLSIWGPEGRQKKDKVSAWQSKHSVLEERRSEDVRRGRSKKEWTLLGLMEQIGFGAHSHDTAHYRGSPRHDWGALIVHSPQTHAVHTYVQGP